MKVLNFLIHLEYHACCPICFNMLESSRYVRNHGLVICCNCSGFASPDLVSLLHHKSHLPAFSSLFDHSSDFSVYVPDGQPSDPLVELWESRSCPI